MSDNKHPELKRRIGLFAAVAIGVGTTVGSGIFSSSPVKAIEPLNLPLPKFQLTKSVHDSNHLISESGTPLFRHDYQNKFTIYGFDLNAEPRVYKFPIFTIIEMKKLY